MSGLKRRAARLARLLLLSALCALPRSPCYAESVYTVTESQLQALEADMLTMRRAADELTRYVQEQGELLKAQEALTASLRTSSQKYERQARTWRKAATVEGCMLLGLAAGFCAWQALK